MLAWRVGRQHLASRMPASGALDVVSDVCGLHAQVMSSAELTLWARVDELARDGVATALWEDRTLVKTWAMRGTLHLLRADELGLYVGAQGALPDRFDKPSWLRGFGVTRPQVDTLLEAVPRALGGRPLTREQLSAAVAEETGDPVLGGKLRDGFGSLLKLTEFRGDVAFAPSEGRNVPFVHPSRWLDDFAPDDPDVAMAEIVRRYLAAYGPATRDQFQRWFGFASAAQAGKRIVAIGDELVEVDVEGTTTWALAADLDSIAAARPAGTVNLLPAFDQYVVSAPRDAPAVLDPEHRPAVYRKQGWLSPVLLVDGAIAGVWEHERSRDRLAVTIAPFTKQPKSVCDARRAGGGTPRGIPGRRATRHLVAVNVSQGGAAGRVAADRADSVEGCPTTRPKSCS